MESQISNRHGLHLAGMNQAINNEFITQNPPASTRLKVHEVRQSGHALGTRITQKTALRRKLMAKIGGKQIIRHNMKVKKCVGLEIQINWPFNYFA